MRAPVHLFSRIWIIIPIGALGFLVWINHARIQRIEYVSSLPGRAESVDVLDPASPTGYAHRQRELIIPERAENSFHWIAETQQMFAQREWRVRRVDYENAPFGREVSTTSPYRWWLGLVAWVDHTLSGRPIGLSVEQAALWTEPVLHGLLLLGLTILVAWRFGTFAAALLAVGLVTVFPFAAGFLPGVPDNHGLANGCALGSILALLAGTNSLRAGADHGGAGFAGRPAGRWFVLAGIVGGIGAWISVSIEVPILAGISFGALMAAWIVRRSRDGNPTGAPMAPLWRLWACSGGATILMSYLIEFFPTHLGSWRLNAVHPLYGLAWIGAGELLTRAVAWIQRGGDPLSRDDAMNPAHARGQSGCQVIGVGACLQAPPRRGLQAIPHLHPPSPGLRRTGREHLSAVASSEGGSSLLQIAWIRLKRRQDLIVIVLATAAIAAVPVVMKLTQSRGFLTTDLSSFKLTEQPHGAAASSLWAWLIHDGMTAGIWSTVMPVVLVFPAVWLIVRRNTEMAARASLALVLGPAAVAFAFACSQLSWWRVFDGVLLVLAASAVPAYLTVDRRSGRWLWTCLAALVMIPGVIQLWPQRITKTEDELTSSEAEELIERDLAHWLAKHAGDDGAIVFAPPRETASLSFFGGLRGVGTLSAYNDDGLRAAVMIASATSLPEAQILIRARRIRYIVIPSWDPFFDEYARLYLVKAQSNRKSILIPELRRLVFPPWLRPLPCQILKIGGYEEESVLVVEVVDEQSPAVAMSRLAEYLLETGRLDQAASTGEALRRFPGDVGALAARCQVLSARGDPAALTQTLNSLLSRLSNGDDRFLPWDRRVSLAMVLARAGRGDLAREQVRRCLAELSEKKLRSLSTGSLYNLLVLSRSFGLVATDPKLRELSLDLLPGDLRSSL